MGHTRHTEALDDIQTGLLRSSAQLQGYLLVDETSESVKLLQHLLFSHHKAFPHVVAEAEPPVDDVVHSMDEERNQHLQGGEGGGGEFLAYLQICCFNSTLSLSLSLSLSATGLEKAEHATDAEYTEDSDKSENSGRGELGVSLRQAQLNDNIHQGHGQDEQVKQVPLAEEVILPKSDNL